jgi:hypothetical protein
MAHRVCHREIRGLRACERVSVCETPESGRVMGGPASPARAFLRAAARDDGVTGRGGGWWEEGGGLISATANSDG